MIFTHGNYYDTIRVNFMKNCLTPNLSCIHARVAMHLLSVTNCSFDALFVVLTEAGRGVNLPSLGPQRLVKSHVLNHCLRLDQKGKIQTQLWKNQREMAQNPGTNEIGFCQCVTRWAYIFVLMPLSRISKVQGDIGYLIQNGRGALHDLHWSDFILLEDRIDFSKEHCPVD